MNEALNLCASQAFEELTISAQFCSKTCPVGKDNIYTDISKLKLVAWLQDKMEVW